MGRRSPRSWTLALCGLALGACGQHSSLPAACTLGPDAVRTALRRAPRSVRLEGTRLSTCVARADDPGELQALGGSLVGAAARLADDGRRHPGGPAGLELGYLLGAARRGAGPVRGERSELLRRLEQETAPFQARGGAFRRGLQAGGSRG